MKIGEAVCPEKYYFLSAYFSHQPPISITPILGARIYSPALVLQVSPDAPARDVLAT
jgi:hypothetical protein